MGGGVEEENGEEDGGGICFKQNDVTFLKVKD